MAQKDYDIVVIGGGAAGLTASGLAANMGALTLMVEQSQLGGDCTWNGCVPSKALLKAAKVAHLTSTAGRYGLSEIKQTVDIAKVLKRVHLVQEQIYEDADHPSIYEGYGVEVSQGRAKFKSSQTLEIDSKDGKKVVSFRYAIIATGSRPRIPPIQGLDGVRYLTNESIFSLQTLPERLAIVGAGPIGIELSQAFQRFGSMVSVFETGPAILPKDETNHTELLYQKLQAEGVHFRLETQVVRVSEEKEKIVVEFKTAERSRQESFDALLLAAGREPQVGSLDLDAAAVKTDQRGNIAIDRHCRTSQKNIYACGDVAGSFQFTHYAEHMAKIAVGHALLRAPTRLERKTVPWVTYTDPEVAHVGAQRKELEKEGREHKVYRFPFAKVDRAVVTGVPDGWVHIFATRWTGQILGASIIGENAGEMIAELTLAMKHKIPLRKIADTIHAYPTFALGNRRAADQWYVQQSSPRLVRILQKLRGLRGRVPSPPDPEGFM